ncbi:hypothetical protein H5410_064405 [Solanum commersonii]|uniref:Uncharacterized protein n=1 Tax=Solanum commersonii TaxID=4109 RepID=A0A9J5VZK6_SOLCO|nr:hypothetical protein H5410_064405 [Solanum commersonii]
MTPSPLKSYPCYHPDLENPMKTHLVMMKDLSKVVFLHTHLANFGCPKLVSTDDLKMVVAVLFEGCLKNNDAPFYGTI